jgi:hypothetical protein
MASCYLCGAPVGSTGSRVWVPTSHGSWVSVGRKGSMRVGGGSRTGLRTLCSRCVAHQRQSDALAAKVAFFLVLIVLCLAFLPTFWGGIFAFLLVGLFGGHGAFGWIHKDLEAKRRIDVEQSDAMFKPKK